MRYVYRRIKKKLKRPFKELQSGISALSITQGLILEALNSEKIRNSISGLDNTWMDESRREICHAMGTIDNKVYTNSLEAFEKNYQKGFRIFECDIELTRDVVPVLVHDWRQFNNGEIIHDWSKVDKDKIVSVPTYYTFKNIKISGQYTSLSLYDLVLLAKKYEAARFIISLKTSNYSYDDKAQFICAVLSRMINMVDEKIYERIILQVHGLGYAAQIRGEHRFKSLMYGMRSIHDEYTMPHLKKLTMY